VQLKNQPILEDFLITLEDLCLRSMDIFIDFFAVNMSFQDPVHRVSGRDAMYNIYLVRLKLLGNTHYRVDDFAWGRKAGMLYFHWEINMGDRCSDGMTELCFTPDQKIISYKEFWSGESPLDCKAYKKAIFG